MPPTRSHISKFSSRSVRAVSARCIAPAIRGSAAPSRSKCCSPAIVSDPGEIRGAERYGRRLTRLSHPNIAMLFEGGQDGDRYYLVFEFVQGQPLASLINGRPLQVRRALEFSINLADALAEAHAADLIHGDIRPDTIMITPKDRAKFMNFGLAPFTGGGVARLSAGSPYVAPEELAGKPADARSDIYSLGAVMFEMFTGKQSARGLVLSGLNPHVPPELEQIIARMLAATVDHRAQSAATVAAELRGVAAILDTRTEAAEAAGVPPRRRRSGRGRGVAIFLIVLLVLAGLIVAWLIGGRAPDPFRDCVRRCSLKRARFLPFRKTAMSWRVRPPGRRCDRSRRRSADAARCRHPTVAPGAEHAADACPCGPCERCGAGEGSVGRARLPAPRRSVSV